MTQHKFARNTRSTLTEHRVNQKTSTNKKPTVQRNKLLDASRKLLSIISQLKQNNKFYDALKLREHLINEIDTFQTDTKNANYNHETILVGRYILSVSLDEIINKTTWGKEVEWNEHSLLKELKQDMMNDDRFFLILEKVCHTPDKFVDLIELMYVCLSLGYEGKFNTPNGQKNSLQQIIDYAYKTIQIQRIDFEQQLSPSLSKKIKITTKAKKSFSSIGTITVTLLFIAFIYLGLNTFLTIFSTPVNHQLDSIASTSHYGVPHEQ